MGCRSRWARRSGRRSPSAGEIVNRGRGQPGLARWYASIMLVSISIEAVAAGFAALSDPHRLRILEQLATGEHCVCDIQESVGLAPNLLSYHLRVLREAGLISATKRGRWVDYRLVAEALEALAASVPGR